MASFNLFDLWNFAAPAESESRFRSLLAGASPDDRIILQTQIARTYGLRLQFGKAREILSDLESQVGNASPEARARFHLELGRTHCSAAHPSEQLNDQAVETARAEYTRAFEIAKEASLDYLAIDALHMMTMVDTEPDQQIEWNRKALAYMQQSSQSDAKRWEASLQNNMGYSLSIKGDFDGALQHFQLALLAREKAGEPLGIRIARWMVAKTLRQMGRLEEALTMQLDLERSLVETGESDEYVIEELKEIYTAMGNSEKAAEYASKREALLRR